MKEKLDQQTHDKRILKGKTKYSSDDLVVGRRRHSENGFPSSVMPIAARANLPNMIVLYLLKKIEGNQGNWRF